MIAFARTEGRYRMHTKFIFVTGGVVSSLGKGITAASLGRLLKSRGLKVSMQKFDPYINVDPGTMNPYQHGEVFVTDDGAETDLDLGHYERFIDESLTQAANVTSGRVYYTVITRERKGEYLGATIQVIPHITNEIKRRMLEVSLKEDAPDVVITEIGGTVGDIECLPFLEAIAPTEERGGPRERAVYPRDARAVSLRGGRAQDQADAAFRQGAGRSGHSAGYHRLPQREADSPRCARQDRPVLQHSGGLRVRESERAQHCTKCR